MPSVFLLCAVLTSQVPYQGGLLALDAGLALVNVQDARIARMAVEPDPRGPGYLGPEGSIAAIDLGTGKPRWTAPGVSGPFHVSNGKAVAWANDAEQAVAVVLDLADGKVLRRLTLFPVPPRKPGAIAEPCSLAPRETAITQRRLGGSGDAIFVATESYYCPAGRPRGGARMTDEDLAEDRARCTSTRSATQWNLTSGKEMKAPPRPEPVRLLEHGPVMWKDVQLALEGGALVARRDGKKLWSAPRAIVSEGIGPPCPSPPSVRPSP